MFKHILIATDGSELADRGVDQGLELAAKLGAKVTALCVTEPLHPGAVEAAVTGGVSDPVGLYERQMDEHVALIGTSIESRARKLGVAVEIARETDDFPAEAIVRTAKLNQCDLIVMSSHGRRGIQKVLLGSQTSEVLVHTSIPVLVIR